MCYSFDFLAPDPISADKVRDVARRFAEEAPDGWACWAFSNHDVVRHASRWADKVEDRDGFLRMAVTLILSLRGSVCLYQGEELGLTEALVAFEDLQDPYGIQFWPTFKGRDGCRTPMIWAHNQAEAGFTDGKPWLPVPPEHLHLAANVQDGDEGSLLEYYREALAFRARYREFAKGDLTFVTEEGQALVFTREHDGKTMFCAINMGETPVTVSLPGEGFEAVDGPGMAPADNSGGDKGTIELPAYGNYFARSEG